MEKYYVTKKNDIYVYFQLIKEIEPEKIVDIGMFLKRIGAISRNVLDNSIHEQIVMEGTDVEESPNTKICDTIYNRIYSLEDMLSMRCDTTESCLVMMMDLTDLYGGEKLDEISKWVSENAGYVLLDAKTFSIFDKYVESKITKELVVDEDKYYLTINS